VHFAKGYPIPSRMEKINTNYHNIHQKKWHLKTNPSSYLFKQTNCYIHHNTQIALRLCNEVGIYYIWRHDCVFLALTRGIQHHLEKIYAYLPRMRASENPPIITPEYPGYLCYAQTLL